MKLRRRVFPFVGIWFLCVAVAQWGYASQKTGDKRAPATTTDRKPARIVLSVGAGFGLPISNSGLTQFWNGGPCLSATFLIPANRLVAVGVGVDGALLKFKQSGFTAAYPGVAVQSRDLGYLSVYLSWRYNPFYRYRFAPYFGANVGMARYTGAIDWEVINGARKTYYFIPGIARLAVAGLGGLDVVLAPSTVLEFQCKITYMHNDPNAALVFLGCAGFRFAL